MSIRQLSMFVVEIGIIRLLSFLFHRRCEIHLNRVFTAKTFVFENILFVSDSEQFARLPTLFLERK